MERLITLSKRKTAGVKSRFKRYLYHVVDWSEPLTVISGHRGAGKTTLLLQKVREFGESAIYLSLDDIYFETFRLVELMEKLYGLGYRHFLLDEVHRYPYWSKDLKLSFDNFSDITVVATGSSILEVSRGQSDLSRRAATWHLPGLSFREYLELAYDHVLSPLSLVEITSSHTEISAKYSDKFDVEKTFREYLKIGYYPFFKDGKGTYPQKLRETINLVLDVDIAAFEEISYSTVRNMKKLLYIVSQSVPFTPNISKLSERMNVPRNSVLRILDLLDQSDIISLLRRETKGISYLQKPEKIYLQNPNTAWVLAEDKPNPGNLRETFFFSQLKVNHQVTSSRFGDFMVDDRYVFEIGGPSKTAEQIRGVPNAFVVSDGIKGGVGNRIPLWLFGFLY